MARPKLNIFLVLLALLVILSIIPIAILIGKSISNLDTINGLAKETIGTIAREQSDQIYKSQARNLAQRIADFLKASESNLEILSQISPTPEAYLSFSQTQQRWLKSQSALAPLYKEVAYIDRRGREIIKIVDNKIVPPEQLKDVSLPENTAYKSETYFQAARAGGAEIHVTHLAGWYVSQPEQLKQGKTYNGVLRFCKKRQDPPAFSTSEVGFQISESSSADIRNPTSEIKSGNFTGIYMLALDHRHLMDFIYRDANGEGSLLEDYRLGDYAYIFDDEGWIIAHPKLWDIRGVDKNGVPLNSFTESTPKWTIEAGVLPVNLFAMDWRLYDINTNEPISSIVQRVQRGETALATIKSLGIAGESEGVVRTRVYAPIFYGTGDYAKHGIFGGVVIGTALEDFLKKTNAFTAVIEKISDNTKTRTILVAALISLAMVFFSFVVARSMAKSLRQLNSALAEIGRKNYVVPEVSSPIKEITELSSGVKRLAGELAEKDQRLNQNIKDLEIVNAKLAAAKKELDSQWKREYEIESDSVLEEKIKSYEKVYPKLKEIRENICIGNSPQFLRVLRQIVPQSQMSIPTWLYGESGVGKTALARAIHLLSPRCDKPFQAFAASEFAAADPMIVLGKLFGYGAGHGIRGIDKNGQKGIIEECDGGTLFIDDTDALPLETQAQLLRVVDGLSFHPAAGKSANITADVRFLFASHIDLEQRVKEGAFRKDLFRRMGGGFNRIVIPALRERKLDIPLLARHFLENYSKRFGPDFPSKEFKGKSGFHLADEALHVLMSHDYAQGNIAELEVLIKLACENARIEGDATLSEKHFPAFTKIENHRRVEMDFSSRIFNQKEMRELAVLRKNKFRMETSEEELGYERGSRTLSHHLRGMCLKALAHADWKIEAACRCLTGEENEGKNQIIVKQRIDGYIRNLAEKGDDGQKQSLYKNLPKEYHSFVVQAIEHFENNS